MTETSRSIERVFREEHGRVLAGIVSAVRDIDLAEEVLQEAFSVALVRWPKEGVPDRPAAWITTVARNRALDRIRRTKIFEGKAEALRRLAELQPAGIPSPDDAEDDAMRHAYPDDQLRLIFTCCHPALATEARVALTLRLLGGLTTAEIAAAFLLTEATMAQRLVRAKRKIKDAGIPYRVPPTDVLQERIGSVLVVLYLIFNEGYAATGGDALIRSDLCDEAIRLAVLLVRLLPGEGEVHGLLALLLLHDARRAGRVDPAKGGLILLEHQDRGLWDPSRIVAGLNVLAEAISLGPPGRYQLQAAISAEHVTAPSWKETNWSRIIGLYDQLLRVAATPVVALNRLVAVAMDAGADAALGQLDPIAKSLPGFYKVEVVRGHLLSELGRHRESAEAYRLAVDSCPVEAERQFLRERLRSVELAVGSQN